MLLWRAFVNISFQVLPQNVSWYLIRPLTGPFKDKYILIWTIQLPLAVYLWLSCWNGNVHLSLTSVAVSTRFSSRISLYLALHIVPSTLTSHPISCWRKVSHHVWPWYVQGNLECFDMYWLKSLFFLSDQSTFFLTKTCYDFISSHKK